MPKMQVRINRANQPKVSKAAKSFGRSIPGEVNQALTIYYNLTAPNAMPLYGTAISPQKTL